LSRGIAETRCTGSAETVTEFMDRHLEDMRNERILSNWNRVGMDRYKTECGCVFDGNVKLVKKCLVGHLSCGGAIIILYCVTLSIFLIFAAFLDYMWPSG
jgi:hypothetical protein